MVKQVFLSVGLLISFQMSMASVTKKDASLITVADFGQTEAITFTTHKPKTPIALSTQLKTINTFYFHPKSNLLTLGKVIPRSHNLKLHHLPIAIIGCDQPSAKWLKFYEKSLKKIHATGFVVNCNGQREFEALEKVSSIRLMPFNGDLLAKRFKVLHLEHYPVLITQHYLTQ